MNESNDFYSFEYNDGDSRHLSMSVAPGDSWPEVMEQLVGFLGNVYGYDIREKVGIRYSPFVSLDDTWTGAVFDPEDSL